MPQIRPPQVPLWSTSPAQLATLSFVPDPEVCLICCFVFSFLLWLTCCSAFSSLSYLPTSFLSPPQSAGCYTHRLCVSLVACVTQAGHSCCNGSFMEVRSPESNNLITINYKNVHTKQIQLKGTCLFNSRVQKSSWPFWAYISKPILFFQEAEIPDASLPF